MERTYLIEEERRVISGFSSMPKEELESLCTDLHLTMTVRDLCYCQNQYRMRERRDPTAEELHFLDALYASRTGKAESYGLRALYTSDPMLAETYADLIAKANHVRREERPYTPLELSGILTKSLLRAGKQVSVPSLRVGDTAPLHALKNGYVESGCAVLGNTSAIVAQKCVAVSFPPEQSRSTDHIILLCPGDFSASSFAMLVSKLPLPTHTQIIPIDRGGLVEALLRLGGVYLIQNYLPGADDTTPLAAWANSYTDGILLRVDGESAQSIRDIAARAGLVASIIGKCTTNQVLTVRREGQTPLQWEVSFLRAFSPILPVDAEIPYVSTAQDIHVTSPITQTVVEGGNCALFSTGILNTPYALCDGHILTGAVSYPSESIFLSALFTTLHAVNRAVAAGADYETLTLSNQITLPDLPKSPGLAVGELMSAMLGSYRAQAELALPDVGGCIRTNAEIKQATSQTFAATTAPTKLIPHTFTATGNNVYLLTPLIHENTLLDFDDYRKLLRYVHHLCTQGIAHSAIAIDAGGAYAALRTMTHSGYGFLADKAIPAVTCGFLIETSEIIQGTLLGVTTAAPTICVETNETPIKSYRRPTIHPDRAPMSEIGVENPVLCVAQTSHLGSLLPIAKLCDRHRAVLLAPLATHPHSRLEMTALANDIRSAHITVLVGTTNELSQILAHPRVAYAKKDLLSRGGLMLCLHTDAASAKNAWIPSDHPFFYKVPSVLYELCAVRTEDENASIVYMRADSAAIPDMLASAIAYFQ